MSKFILRFYKIPGWIISNSYKWETKKVMIAFGFTTRLHFVNIPYAIRRANLSQDIINTIKKYENY